MPQIQYYLLRFPRLVFWHLNVREVERHPDVYVQVAIEQLHVKRPDTETTVLACY